VSGATGLVGRALCAHLAAGGVPFRVLSRNPRRARRLAPGGLSYHQWQPIERGRPWVSVVEGSRAVVHLASPLAAGGRWTPEHKQVLYDNCIVGTQGLVSAVAQATSPPEVFVSASTVGYYRPGDRGGEPADEAGQAGQDFVSSLAADWEAAAAHAADFGIRQVSLRSGLVLSRRGALRRLRWAGRLGLGGPIPPGSQAQSWIHLADELGLLLLAIDDRRLGGPLNCVAPQPVSSAEFMSVVRKQVGVPFGLSSPAAMLPGAVAATSGRAAIPGRALALGYDFIHPDLEEALRAA
jgi:uncharacterized protein (TIGR01777 family)